MNRILFAIIGLYLATACSSIDKSVPISHIDVEHRGKHNTQREHMAAVCKGFFMSAEKVKKFYDHAALIRDKGKNKTYEMLPCYATGSAYIYGEKYTWIIRAGGIGEFFNDKNRFTKICGKKCCNKVKNIC